VVRLDLVEGTTTSITLKKIIIKNIIHKKSEVVRLDLVEGTTISITSKNIITHLDSGSDSA
jgi:hypothetical protein